MPNVTTNAITGALSQQGSSEHSAFRDLDLESFLKLLITELRNQDPLKPMDTSEIFTQVSQIREIESNQRLTQTLNAVLLGQNIATASSLLGWTIRGLADNGSEVQGIVERVSLEQGASRVYVNGEAIRLENIREVLPIQMLTENG